jgi:uncharacterized protein YndB with AHSA1/START domain
MVGRGVARRSSGLALHLEALVRAPRQLVFEACLDPERLAKWWGPRGFTSPSIASDRRVGGRYRIAMQPPDGELFYLRGDFREIGPPRRLVYSFEWEEPHADDQETVVTLSFADVCEGTRVTLEQGPFATEARRALHEAGWTDGFVRLDDALRAENA